MHSSSISSQGPQRGLLLSPWAQSSVVTIIFSHSALETCPMHSFLFQCPIIQKVKHSIHICLCSVFLKLPLHPVLAVSEAKWHCVNSRYEFLLERENGGATVQLLWGGRAPGPPPVCCRHVGVGRTGLVRATNACISGLTPSGEASGSHLEG